MCFKSELSVSILSPPQIEKLEVKRSGGADLNADQLDKLSRKQDVLAGLQLLQKD